MQDETIKRHKPTLVVNLFGAPGAGKSTAAAYIFALLKMAEINAELVTEFAKDLVWEESKEPFDNQAYIFGQQYFRMSRCKDKVDVIVTDSPLLLSVIYNRHPNAGFTMYVFNSFDTFENRNYYLNRTHQFDESGRIHSERESNAIADKIKLLLRNYSVPYIGVDSTEKSYRNIANEIISILKKQDVQDDEDCSTGYLYERQFLEWFDAGKDPSEKDIADFVEYCGNTIIDSVDRNGMRRIIRKIGERYFEIFRHELTEPPREVWVTKDGDWFINWNPAQKGVVTE